jgi:hypothetical protein
MLWNPAFFDDRPQAGVHQVMLVLVEHDSRPAVDVVLQVAIVVSTNLVEGPPRAAQVGRPERRRLPTFESLPEVPSELFADFIGDFLQAYDGMRQAGRHHGAGHSQTTLVASSCATT